MTWTSPQEDPRIEALKADHGRRMSRIFLTFALIEGAALAGAVMVVFVLGLVAPRFGVWVIVGIAIVGGLLLILALFSRLRAYQRDLRDITGD